IVSFVGWAAPDSVPPRVVETNPLNGTLDVDPSLKEISVTFSETMMDQNWSWAYDDKDKFPQMTGQPYYTEKMTKNILPVKLEPNKEYVVWINSVKFKNFKDKVGNPVQPFKFTFKTK
ncbi:MAG: Ig-like domain-containing protein, partial [Deltaproteobacteria bacterium]|nr:Ig-like domain-containing protein [Deltaproteobacteria bacterium]